jgi:hypothetical protein
VAVVIAPFGEVIALWRPLDPRRVLASPSPGWRSTSSSRIVSANAELAYRV